MAKEKMTMDEYEKLGAELRLLRTLTCKMLNETRDYKIKSIIPDKLGRIECCCNDLATLIEDSILKDYPELKDDDKLYNYGFIRIFCGDSNYSIDEDNIYDKIAHAKMRSIVNDLVTVINIEHEN